MEGMTATAVYNAAAKVWKNENEELRLARTLIILHITLDGYGSADYADSIANSYNEDWEDKYGYVSGDEVFDLLSGLGL